MSVIPPEMIPVFPGIVRDRYISRLNKSLLTSSYRDNLCQRPLFYVWFVVNGRFLPPPFPLHPLPLHAILSLIGAFRRQMVNTCLICTSIVHFFRSVWRLSAGFVPPLLYRGQKRQEKFALWHNLYQRVKSHALLAHQSSGRKAGEHTLTPAVPFKKTSPFSIHLENDGIWALQTRRVYNSPTLKWFPLH